MKEVLLNITFTAVSLCLFRMIAGERHAKQLNFLTSLVFALCVAAMAGGNFLKLNLADISVDTAYVNFERTTAENLKREVAKEMNTRVRDILSEYECVPEKIYVIVNISQWNSISISEIKLVLNEGNYSEAIARLKEKLGGEISVTVEK